MASILNSTMLDSDTAILDSNNFLSSLRFTQKHSPSTLTLTQTNSIWLKLIHSHSTWWWQPSSIWPSWIQPILVFPLKLTLTCQDWFPPFAQERLHFHFPPHHLHKKTSLIHSDSTCWWQSSWILPCWIPTPCFLLSDSLKNTLTPLWLTRTNINWLKLIHSHSTWWWQPSWILPSWIWPSWIQPS